jgi:hypothetical protein
MSIRMYWGPDFLTDFDKIRSGEQNILLIIFTGSNETRNAARMYCSDYYAFRSESIL